MRKPNDTRSTNSAEGDSKIIFISVTVISALWYGILITNIRVKVKVLP